MSDAVSSRSTVCHGRDELVLVPLAERLEDRGGERLRARLELVPFPFATRREGGTADTAGRTRWAHEDQPFRLETRAAVG